MFTAVIRFYAAHHPLTTVDRREANQDDEGLRYG